MSKTEFNRIIAFGDSFIVGDQDDPNQCDDYLRYNVSFVAILSRKFKVSLINYAVRGSSNFPQIDKLWCEAYNGNLSSKDLILFGITTPVRERTRIMDLGPEILKVSRGECIVDRELIKNNQLMWETDYFYTLCLLDAIEKKFGLTILKFNLFDNVLDYTKSDKIEIFRSNNFINFGMPGNTLMDILQDTVGQSVKYPYHTKAEIKKSHRHLFTPKNHPSPEGHSKIAEWFYRYLTT